MQTSCARKIRKHLIVYSAVLLALFGVSLFVTHERLPRKEHEKLLALSDGLIAYELSGNSLSLHYTMAHPESFAQRAGDSFDPARICLPVYTENTPAETEAVYSGLMTRLSEIDARKLSAHDLWIYRIMEQSLRSSLSELTMPFYGEPLSPSSGEQTSLLILFAEYRIHSREDAERYLDTLSCVGDYFDGLLLYEQQKAEAGLFMSDAAVTKVIAQCDTLCSKEQLAQGSHFLQVTFRSRLNALLSEGLCTESEMQQYLARHDAILTGIVAPAYARLADGLFLLKGSGTNEQGLCHYADGRRYYETRLAALTGSSRTPEEIMTLLTENFAADYDTLFNIISALSETLPDPTQALLTAPGLLDGYTPEEMVGDLHARMTEDFPALPAVVLHEIKPVDDALSPYTSPAFYMIPAIDDYRSNSIYINYGDEPDSLTLYTTLAHEGYPGHLYQNVYHLGDMNVNSLMPLEGVLSYGGYAEGWATYVEDLSYSYAAQLMQESETASHPRHPQDSGGTADDAAFSRSQTPASGGAADDAALSGSQTPASGDTADDAALSETAAAYSPETLALLCDFYRTDRRIQLCLYSMLDVSIHYYGMTFDETAALLSAYGISDTDVIKSVYEYIVEEPVNYLKYYLGYLEIVSLKETAKEVWGEAYSDMRFHTFFLSAGPAPFAMLREALLTSAP
ncbi:MAG: DUF885 domain-containing protein [bacterium]|nr:DUF885 domain-containing protein [Clostridium sp.]MCM1537681.1 DUF885 domain-containing protein [bacterium]